MDSPLAYYTTAAALQADQRDLATTIRQLSNDTIKLDEQFQAVYSDIKSQEMFDTSPTAPSNQWAETRKVSSNAKLIGGLPALILLVDLYKSHVVG